MTRRGDAMRSDKEEELRRRARGETLEFWGRSDVHDGECVPEIDVVEEEVLNEA